VVRWGGSSADTAEVPPGRSTHLLIFDIGRAVRTTEDGMVHDVDPQVGFGTGQVGCSLPVPRLN
jgi:hypothetical protein